MDAALHFPCLAAWRSAFPSQHISSRYTHSFMQAWLVDCILERSIPGRDLGANICLILARIEEACFATTSHPM
ncbi:hypothetical protein EV356DRAFT_347033 [Viridothelium virens]|uniref:Uncharacterized protein n=1 Tax=Viridothelium virens TaxID=1048519 RepID=A0A6A6GXD5_VIRVR|nr:hypothetical protein EV356DRAFT_347033 [Viridothelium virens]